MNVSKCEYNDCNRRNNCHRFVNGEGTVINFKVICYMQSYQWYMPIKDDVSVELIESNDND